jgi:6-phosphogluconolactonase
MIKKNNTEIKIYSDLDDWSRSSAIWIRDTIQSSIETNGRCSIALSGGRTPRKVYRKLASAAISSTIQWEHLYAFWGDERVVGPDHPDSNYRMVRENLLDNVPLPAENIFRMKGELPPEESVEDYHQILSEHFSKIHENTPVFDLILLGLNVDGHIASLFPHTDLLSENEKRWVASTYVPRLNSWRITLTPRILNNARRIAFLVFGNKKSEILKQVFEGPHNPDRYPAQLIQPSDGKVVWLIDQAAARLLSISD